jgi:hypothetical protein
MGTPSTPSSIGTVNAPGTVYGAIFAADDHIHRLGNGSIDSATLFNNSVVSSNSLSDLAVTTDKLTDDLLTTEAMSDLLIVESKLANLNVTTEKIADGNVTSEKIDNLAVTSDKIGALQVVGADLASNSVTEAKLAAGSVTSSDILVGVTLNQLTLSNPTITPGSTANIQASPVQLTTPIVKTKRRQYGPINFVSFLSTVVGGRWRIPVVSIPETNLFAWGGFNFITLINWTNAPESISGWDLDIYTQTAVIGVGQGFNLQIRGGMVRPFNSVLVNNVLTSVQWQNGLLPPLRTSDTSNVINFQVIKTGEPNTFQVFGSWDTLFMDSFDNLFLQDFFR